MHVSVRELPRRFFANLPEALLASQPGTRDFAPFDMHVVHLGYMGNKEAVMWCVTGSEQGTWGGLGVWSHISGGVASAGALAFGSTTLVPWIRRWTGRSARWWPSTRPC